MVWLDFDNQRKMKIDKSGKVVYTRYPTPNIYFPFISNGDIIASTMVVVKTDGWVATSQEKIVKNEIFKDGIMNLKTEEFAGLGIHFSGNDYFMDYRNIGNFCFSGNSFRFDTKVLNNSITDVCASFEIELRGDNGKYGVFYRTRMFKLGNHSLW
ncbi:MAG: hypothetical protein HC905_31960 [Bacteroidales bacterium]|nr:hypothetical protein [Bacteroidales bacterium]